MKIKKKYKVIGLSIILIILVSYLAYFTYLNFKAKKANKELQQNIPIIIKGNEDEEKNANEEIINTVKDLQNTNTDIKGWIKINDTNINYPLLQGTDNDYYLDHNYQKEYSSYGSIYIDNNSNLDDVNSNVIIYGHSMKDKEMFQNLLNYSDKNYYDNHQIIEIYTNNEARKYEIVTVFRSRVFYQDEKDVFRYYYCYDLSSEEKYNSYINNSKNLELYDTGIEAQFGQQLITLITCDYVEDNSRMVVVAKRVV